MLQDGILIREQGARLVAEHGGQQNATCVGPMTANHLAHDLQGACGDIRFEEARGGEVCNIDDGLNVSVRLQHVGADIKVNGK